MLFETAKLKIKSRYSYLELLEFSGFSKTAKFLDINYGEFNGVYQNVYCGSKSHPKRAKDNIDNINFLKAKEKIEKKFNNIILLEYNGASQKCLCLDKDFGNFSGIYNNIFLGKKKHQNRIKNKTKLHIILEDKISNIAHLKLLKRNKKTFTLLDEVYGEYTITYSNLYSGNIEHPQRKQDQKKKLISDKFDYLELIEFCGNKPSKFLDKEFGDFTGNFYKVLSESKRHPKRSSLNKYNASQEQHVKDKRKRTCLQKYGKTTPLLTFDSIYDFNGKTAKDIYTESNIDFSYTKFLKLIKLIGLDRALNAKASKTDIELIIENIIKNDIKENFIFNKSLLETKLRPDFLLKNHNLIIEADGLLYHSDAVKEDKYYHINKQKIYCENNYKSLFFRSDEIYKKPNIIISMIKYHTGNIDRVIFARKCLVNKSSGPSFSYWFEENHLMGKGSGNVYYLTYNDEIVAGISIIVKIDHIEISRFCNKLNTTVVGGLGKLISKIISDYKPSKIISFVDCRYGTGSSLEKLGFVECSHHLSFKWTDLNNTFHRMKYPGNSGYDFGLFKIWDCGQKKFILN